MAETRVYLATTKDLIGYEVLTDNEFIELAERLGTVYSLKGFENAVNNNEVNFNNNVIRII